MRNLCGATHALAVCVRACCRMRLWELKLPTGYITLYNGMNVCGGNSETCVCAVKIVLRQPSLCGYNLCVVATPGDNYGGNSLSDDNLSSIWIWWRLVQQQFVRCQPLGWQLLWRQLAWWQSVWWPTGWQFVWCQFFWWQLVWRQLVWWELSGSNLRGAKAEDCDGPGEAEEWYQTVQSRTAS